MPNLLESQRSALLVDGFLDNQQFAMNLLEIRPYYQTLVHKQKWQLMPGKLEHIY
jgi:hypothetical protein